MGEESAAMRHVEPLSSETPSTDDPAVIRAEIEQTRAEMSETIEALQDRLSPQHLVDEAKQTVHDATVGKVTTMMNSVAEKASDVGEQVQDQAQYAASYVRENPVPALLIGAGIAWLLMRGSGGSSRPVYSGYSGTKRYPVRRTGSPTSGSTSGWSETASDAAAQVRQRASAYGRTAETTLERWLRENPLTVGTVAVAAGAIVGLGLPRTQTEDAWMGETRDTLVERAQDTAQSAVERVGEMAEQVQQPGGETRQTAGDSGEQRSAAASATTGSSGLDTAVTSGQSDASETGAPSRPRTASTAR
jgi:ElaB/YqjD/DUF883 family membrane-anchored ribosome-binding protein